MKNESNELFTCLFNQIHESINEVESPALNQAEHSVTKSCSADAKGLTVTKS